MWVAIAVGALVSLILLLWIVQIISPAPWERKRRRRQRVSRAAGRQGVQDSAAGRFQRNRR